MTDTAKIISAHCNACGDIRRSYVRAAYSKDGSDSEVSWNDTYRVLECCGCGDVIVQHDYWFSEDREPQQDPSDGEWYDIPVVTTTYFPPAIFRQLPAWYADLRDADALLAEILGEIYAALQNNSAIIATAGTRILLDRAMVMLVGDVGGFDKKLDKMVDEGFIGREDRNLLNAMTDAGNAASHRGYQPSKDNLMTIIDIIENLLHRSFVLVKAVGKVKASTPPRPPMLKASK